MEKFNCLLPSWNEIHDIAKSASDSIKQSGFYPDIIIAVARGGMVPARIFCDSLHVKNCLSIKVDHWGLTATKDGSAKLTHALNADISGKNVLIVDDITDTGQSMEIAKSHILEKNPKNVRTATLFHLTGSKYTPDFFGMERPWAWIIFPWNYTEDMVNIIRKIKSSGKDSIPEIQAELKMNYNVDAEESNLSEMIRHISYLEKQGK